MKLYIDDERPCPPGWTAARTLTEAITTLTDAPEYIEKISIDHTIRNSDETFYPVVAVLCLMVDVGLDIPDDIYLHSADEKIAGQMCDVLNLAGYSAKVGHPVWGEE